MGLGDSISEIFSALMNCFYIVLILSVIVFGYQLQTVNSFRQQVNYRIERRGGLTNEALDEIKKESKENFNSWYSVDSKQLGKKLVFGEEVEYTINASFPVVFVPGLPNVKLTIPGQATSQVR